MIQKGDIVNLQATPNGGTFTITYRHGVSDPIPYGADAALIRYATLQAAERDDVVQEYHDSDANAAADCRVCTPPKVDTSEYFAPDTWRDWVGRIMWRAQRVWWAITADDGADWYGE